MDRDPYEKRVVARTDTRGFGSRSVGEAHPIGFWSSRAVFVWVAHEATNSEPGGRHSCLPERTSIQEITDRQECLSPGSRSGHLCAIRPKTALRADLAAKGVPETRDEARTRPGAVFHRTGPRDGRAGSRSADPGRAEWIDWTARENGPREPTTAGQ